MGYTKTTWTDRLVQYPTRYTKSGETTTGVTLTPDFGTVTAAGTPVNAANLNKIEAGIEAALGVGALAAIQPSGNLNTARGDYAAAKLSTGNNNTAIGRYALWSATTAGSNVAIGDSALYNNNGTANTAVGNSALSNTTTGSTNTAIGLFALNANTTGSNNAALGYNALASSVGTIQNTALGTGALQFRQDGSAMTTFDNCTGVGYDTRVSYANQVQLGNSATTTFAYGAVQNRSDARDKTDIRDTSLGLEFVKALRAVDYRWDYRDDYFVREGDELVQMPKDGSKARARFHHGLIAQEVQAVCDGMGVDFGGFQDHNVNGGDDVLSIGYMELIAPLIKAVQELAAEVADLKAAR